MSEEYLWDRSGDPDPQLADLERTLGTLSFGASSGVPDPWPSATHSEVTPRRDGRPWIVATAAVVSAAVALWVTGWIANERRPGESGAPERVGVEDVRVAPPNAPESPSYESGFSTAERAVVGVVAELELESPSSASPVGRDSAGPEPKRTKGTRRRRAEQLPHKLSAADINKGVAPVRAQAQACGAKFDVPAGTRIKVKFSVLGATGRISTAAARAPWVGTPVGACVARALSRARFSRFQSKSMGVLFPIRLGTAKSERSEGGDAESSRPSVLSTAQLRDGMRPVRARVAACGAEHAVPPGERLKVKLTVAGASGTVTSARALVDADQGTLGRCVEKAVRGAKFPRFEKPSLSAVYPFTM